MSYYYELFVKGESKQANRPLATLGVSLLLFLLLGLRDALTILGSSYPHLFAVLNVPLSTFEEAYMYAPYVTRFHLNIPLPLSPVLDAAAMGFSFFPSLTLLFSGLLFRTLCFSNLDVYLLVGHVLFPLLSFWAIHKIFNRYVSLSWSLLLAFWGITFYANYSSFEYAWRLLTFSSHPVGLGSLAPLEISRTPFPSLSLMVFVWTYYVTTRDYWEKRSQLVWMAVLWTLNYYVYIYNFVAGGLFWAGYFLACKYFRRKSVSNTVQDALCSLGAAGLILAPAAWHAMHLGSADRELLSHLGIVARHAGVFLNPWGMTLSYLIPVLITVLLVRIYCADTYELIYRFTPVFLMIGVEIVILNLHLLLGRFIQPDLFLKRIEPYFFRFFYFLPFIYFFTGQRKTFFHRQLSGSEELADRVHAFFSQYVIRFRAGIATAGILGIAGVVIMSSVRYYRNHVDAVAAPMQQALRQTQALEAFAQTLGPGRRNVVSEDLAVNLLVPLVTPHNDLIGSSFNNQVHTDELIERLTLYAKLFRWEKGRFLDFMMYSDEMAHLETANDFRITDGFLRKGFGYWLIWHKRMLNPDEAESYRRRLFKLYDELPVTATLRKYHIGLIQTSSDVLPGIPASPQLQSEGLRHYVLKESL